MAGENTEFSSSRIIFQKIIIMGIDSFVKLSMIHPSRVTHTNTNARGLTMTIKTKTENSGVRYDLCEGVNGSGRQCWVVQVIRPGKGCVHQDMFLSLSEAENWFEYACG